MSPAITASSSGSNMASPQALYRACAAWDVPEVAKLLETGANPNAAGVGGVTPLFVACYPSAHVHHSKDNLCLKIVTRRNEIRDGYIEECTDNQEATVQLLLRHGADPCLPSMGGDTPLLAAAATSTRLFRVLLEAAGRANSTRTSSTGSSSSSSSSSTVQKQPGVASPLSGTACKADGPPSTGLRQGSCHTTDKACSQNCSSSLQQSAGLLTKVVCIRGCPKALQLLLDWRLVPDLQEALKEAVQVGQGLSVAETHSNHPLGAPDVP
jgi:ankyrin repeat protein